MNNNLPPEDRLLSDPQAAEYLTTTSKSLRQSRHTGILFGEPAPRFLKMGRSVRYRLSTLIAFRNQFPEFDNTTQYSTGNKQPAEENVRSANG